MILFDASFPHFFWSNRNTFLQINPRKRHRLPFKIWVKPVNPQFIDAKNILNQSVSHSFPIQCWLYQLYLYFSSLKHIKPHFWGVGSTLKHSSFSKKHGQFHSIHTLEPVIFLSHFIFSIELNAFPIRFSTKFTKTWTSAGRSAGASAYAPSSPDSVAAAEQPPGRLSHGLHKSRGGGVTMRMWWEKTWEYDTRWCPSSFAKLVYKSNN